MKSNVVMEALPVATQLRILKSEYIRFNDKWLRIVRRGPSGWQDLTEIGNQLRSLEARITELKGLAHA